MAVRLRILIGVCCALVIVSAPSAVRASFIQSVVDLVLSVTGTRVDQYSYRFFAPGGLSPKSVWPATRRAFTENTPVAHRHSPPAFGRVIRLRIGLRVHRNSLTAGDRAFKLQFGTRVTTCAAIASWTDLGDPGSAALWRGYDKTGLTDGTDLSHNLLTGATVKGTYEEQNPTPANPEVPSGSVVEYDWSLQNNIPTADAAHYCFRMVRSDGTPLDDYPQYPEIETSIGPLKTVSQIIDVRTGGTITSDNPDGTEISLDVPASYLLASHQFEIITYDLSDYLDSFGMSGPVEKLGAHSRIYYLCAHLDDMATTSFDAPMTLRMHYANADINGIDASSLQLHRLDSDGWTAKTTTLNNGSALATATISGFSSYALFGDAAPTPTPTPTQQPGGGGGGGGAYVPPPTSADVILEGTGTPGTTVHVVKDGVDAGTVTVLADTSFSTTLKGISAGTYQFGFWASDTQGRRSATVTVSVPVSGTSTTLIRNIVIPPITIADPLSACGKRPDLNGDGKVNLVDFSIMAFWWRRAISEGANIDLNCDGRLTLADFSILAYFWTG